jgi:hypothetical protein
MLLLAGCTGAPSLGATGDAPTGQATGSVDFYVSDEQNAIDDFEHLNVTVTEVGLHRAEAGDDDENDTATPANGTETPEADDEEADEADDDGEWVTRDVNDTTVDLTELRGENATVLTRLNVSNGTYDRAFVYASEIDGVLEGGETTNVKLPSSRLHVNREFSIGANESVDFVYDVTVHRAGKSGKYIVRPVVSQSGTDVPIQEVGREGSLSARFLGTVERGGSATVKVTSDGKPVSDAAVSVNDERYETAGDGTVVFDVPADAEELEVEVEHGEGEVELTRTFPRSDDDGRARLTG